MPTRAGTPRRQWLLILAIAAGLIGMHHLMAAPGKAHGVAHSHTTGAAAMPRGAAAPSHSLHAPAPIPVSASIDSPGSNGASGDRRVATTGATASAPGCGHGMGAMMGHPCLAVLTAAGVVTAAAMILATGSTSHAVLRPMTSEAHSIAARAPPSAGVRLSQLGVLRH